MSEDPAIANDAGGLASAAANLMAGARTQADGLHLVGARDRYRRQVVRAIELGQRALAMAEQGGDARTAASARLTLALAQAARARDARHGAGQLSLGAQRAPTLDACEDGWRKVEAIVAVAEASAAEALRMATAIDKASVRKEVTAARAAAHEARRLVVERNHAYTFHADASFSFGEGWYLAAASVLAEVVIQIEPNKAQTEQVRQFLRDAGLQARIVPYRSRPRANKHLPEIVARAFRDDSASAQHRLRTAFLGEAAIPRAIVDWATRRMTGVSANKKVLLWVRDGKHHPARNTTQPELVALARCAREAGLVPVLVGDAVPDGGPPPDAVDLTLFWKESLFQGLDMRRAQLQLFEHLRAAHGLAGQLGVTTAGMDGPALLGLPTMYLTAAPNGRLGTWVGAIPGYEEIVRGDGYLERIRDRLRQWAASGAAQPPPGAAEAPATPRT
jgi:hypothetical protein